MLFLAAFIGLSDAPLFVDLKSWLPGAISAGWHFRNTKVVSFAQIYARFGS
jgi:hypothetical protein